MRDTDRPQRCTLEDDGVGSDTGSPCNHEHERRTGADVDAHI